MREPNKEQFSKLIMELITSEEQMNLVLSRPDAKAYHDLIEILRYYRQFAE